MAGTRAGGLKAAETNAKRHGEDFYARIGREGGKKGTTGGFASAKLGGDGMTGPERASVAGVIGGTKSKRRPRNAVMQASATQSDRPDTQPEVVNEPSADIYQSSNRHRRTLLNKILGRKSA